MLTLACQRRIQNPVKFLLKELLYTKIINGLKSSTIFAEGSIFNVWQGSGCAPAYFPQIHIIKESWCRFSIWHTNGESKFSSGFWLFISVLLEAADTVLIERVIGKRIDTITGGTVIWRNTHSHSSTFVADLFMETKCFQFRVYSGQGIYGKHGEKVYFVNARDNLSTSGKITIEARKSGKSQGIITCVTQCFHFPLEIFAKFGFSYQANSSELINICSPRNHQKAKVFWCI